MKLTYHCKERVFRFLIQEIKCHLLRENYSFRVLQLNRIIIVDCFPTLHECLTELNFKVDEVSKVVRENFHDLKTIVLQYFPKTSEDESCVPNPFSFAAMPAGLNANDYDNLIDLISDSDLKQKKQQRSAFQ